MLNRLALALALTVATTAGANAEPIRLGLDVWLGYGPLWVADEMGNFERHGIDVELKIIQLDKGMRQALGV